MKNKGGRPRGSKNQPTLFKVKRTKLDSVKLSRECLRIVHELAADSGIAPQMVLEDLILAGNYTMGEAYDNISNQRKRFREKSLNRKHVVPITSTEGIEVGQNGVEPGNEIVGTAAGDEHVPERTGELLPGFNDAASERGHRPEDNPAFGNASELGNVIGTAHGAWAREQWEAAQAQIGDPDYGPVPTDEEGNPIEPQEVHE